MFLFFALIGCVLGKVKRNFWIGVRTPWTLASEQVWNETHRVTAWLWVGVSVAAIVALLCNVPVMFCFVALMVAVLYFYCAPCSRIRQNSGFSPPSST